MRTLFNAQYFIVILVFATMMSVKIEATDHSPNLINSSTPFIYLKQWQIVDDPSPKSPLPKISDSA